MLPLIHFCCYHRIPHAGELLNRLEVVVCERAQSLVLEDLHTIYHPRRQRVREWGARGPEGVVFPFLTCPPLGMANLSFPHVSLEGWRGDAV